MRESTLSIVASMIGVSYVLLYAWAQMEILAFLWSDTKKSGRLKTAGSIVLWAMINAYCFLVAHEVHYDIIRERSLNLYDIETLWAKAVAVLVIVSYWAWVIFSLGFAQLQSRARRRAEAEKVGSS